MSCKKEIEGGVSQEQVDYTPDSETQDNKEKEPKVTCKKCIHKDICYFLTRLTDEAKSMEMSGITKLPFKPEMLAIHCRLYVTKNGETLDQKKESGQ